MAVVYVVKNKRDRVIVLQTTHKNQAALRVKNAAMGDLELWVYRVYEQDARWILIDGPPLH